MSIKNDILNTVDSIKDTFSEAGHKSTAEAEQTRRDVAGDTMTPGEKLGSMGNQVKNEVQGGIDHAKVDARTEV